jgi:outer membrane protein OmpA-like peptidoglycan-associated protein
LKWQYGVVLLKQVYPEAALNGERRDDIMKIRQVLRITGLAAVAGSLVSLFGCAGMEVNHNKYTSEWLYIHKELPAADRAVEAARLAGKSQQCPNEFKAVEELKDSAYSKYKACFTREAIAMANDAAARANALCPPAAQVALPVGGALQAGDSQAALDSQQGKEEPLPPIAAAEPTPDRFKYCITLHTEFDVDKTEIRPQYRDEISKVGTFMKQYPTTTAVIEGHSDNVGDAEYNRDLSQRRAASVVNYLVDTFGIDRSRLTAVGYGMSRPVADNATDAGKQANRRIEAIIDCAFDVQKVTPPDRLCIGLNMEFDTAKADIKPQYRDEIAKVGEYMKQYPTTTAIIEGHTDNIGSYDYNIKLSRQRADNVVAYLVKNFGIEPSRLEARGFGSSRRIAYNSTPEGRQKNRRINAIIDCVTR